jgi:hypothetical protein
MLVLKVDTFEELEQIHESLVGFEPYINNDIIVSKNPIGDGGEVIIGHENDHDLTLSVKIG